MMSFENVKSLIEFTSIVVDNLCWRDHLLTTVLLLLLRLLCRLDSMEQLLLLLVMLHCKLQHRHATHVISSLQCLAE